MTRSTRILRAAGSWAALIVLGVALGMAFAYVVANWRPAYVVVAIVAGVLTVAWLLRVAWLDEQRRRRDTEDSLRYLERTRLQRDRGGVA